MMNSVMVKSVSPAGVVRRGGRNRRKRTKYDLAYKQMELLGPFAEEAKHVDLSKVLFSSDAEEEDEGRIFFLLSLLNGCCNTR